MDSIQKMFPFHVDSPLAVSLLVVFYSLLPTEALLTASVSLVLLQLAGQMRPETSKKTFSGEPKRVAPMSGRQSWQQYRAGTAASLSPLAKDHAPSSSRFRRDAPVQRESPIKLAIETSGSEFTQMSFARRTLLNSTGGELPLLSEVGPDVPLASLGPNLLGAARSTNEMPRAISEILRQSLPGIQVFCFARTRGVDGQVLRCLEVVIAFDENILKSSSLQERLLRGMRGGADAKALSGEKLQKSVLRQCLGTLVDKGYKFRRSAFKAEAPTVFLLAPSQEGNESLRNAVHVEMSVNNPLPLLNASLIREAASTDPRAAALIASVQRWSDARGLAHVSFGPLSSYAWAHLAVFYLQNAAQPAMPRLTPGAERDGNATPSPDPGLLRGFFEFCAADAIWASGPVTVKRCSCREPGTLIEDVYRKGVDLGEQLRNDHGARARFRSEAALALQHFSTRGATVADLLARPDFTSSSPKSNASSASTSPSPSAR